METTALPEVNIPDVNFDPDALLHDSLTIHLGEDIPDPDTVIGKLINDLKTEGMETEWLEAVKKLSHDEKVEWLSSLPETSHPEPATSFVILVEYPLVSTIMTVVAKDAAGNPVYKEKRIERKVQKCVPRNK